MSAPRDLDRMIQSFLAEGPMELPDPSYDEVRDRMEQKRQRALIGPWRTSGVNSSMRIRLGIAAAAVVLAVMLGIGLLDPNVGDAPDASAPSEASAQPSEAASPLPLPIWPDPQPFNFNPFDEPLRAGTYSLTSFPVGITFDVPTGEAPIEWSSCSEASVQQSVCYMSPRGSLVAVEFLIVENVVADPCWLSVDPLDPQLLDPPVGPSVEALVTAISSLEGFGASAPLDITMDGFHGKQLTLTAPGAECDGLFMIWKTASRPRLGFMGMEPDAIKVLRILDVGGVRVVISGSYHPAEPGLLSIQPDITAMQQLIATVRIEQ